MRKGIWGLLAAILLLWGTNEPKAAPSAAQAAPTIPNLVAHWGFEQAAGGPSTDSSGNGNTGTHVGSPAVGAASPFPGSTQSLVFSQTGTTRLDVPDSPSLSLTGSLTLAAWINVTDGATMNNQHGIIEKHDGGGGYFLRLNGSEYIGFTLFGAGGAEVGAIGSSPRDVATGWTHVAATYDSGTGAMTMYKNGTPDATTGTASGPPVDGPSTLRLGRDFGANGLNGMMDEARIYNKALSVDEIGVLRLGQPPVTGVIATGVAGGVQVDWTAPTIPAGMTVTYAVLIGDSAMGPWTLDAQGITGTTHIVTGLPVQPFYFQVIAVSVVASNPATSGAATPLAAGPPPAPNTNDGDEGLLDGKCECGTVRGAGMTALWAGLVLALGALLAARRR